MTDRRRVSRPCVTLTSGRTTVDLFVGDIFKITYSLIVRGPESEDPLETDDVTLLVESIEVALGRATFLTSDGWRVTLEEDESITNVSTIAGTTSDLSVRREVTVHVESIQLREGR